MNTDRLAVFAKYWQPGAVKTRLARGIGAESAAALHRQFLRTLLQRFSAVAAARVLVYSPAERERDFAGLAEGARDSWQLEPQSAGDLGQRMAACFQSAFRQGCERVVLIGSDSPTLPVSWITQAFDELATYPVVLGPSSDGGYYLVGASRTVPPIFEDIRWGTDAVWDQTLRRLDAAGIPVALLAAWYDVDEVEDLRRLAAELSREAEDDLRELTAVVNAALGTSH
jgi:rSAM/selenodomain-associated transferase 1